MGKMIANLRWVPHWVSHLGCIKGCLNHLNLEVSDAWLFGATGHAFIINMHEGVCPSGPTAWNTEMLSRLGKNLGYAVSRVVGAATDANQRLAWGNTQLAIDEELPCYGWELDIPEYCVVYGYDDVGYYFSGPLCDKGRGPKPWRELGTSQIGVLEMYTVRPGQPADDRTTVREALAFALEFAEGPENWIFPEYRSGLAGYDRWIHALEVCEAHNLGMAYNAAVWSECRGYAVAFLKEAKTRLHSEATDRIDEATRQYEVVAENLKAVLELYPFRGPDSPPVEDNVWCREAREKLGAARAAEESGLAALSEIVVALG